MTEVIDRVESNIKAHVDTTRDTFSKEVTIVKTAAKDILALKPVQGVISLIADSIDNVGDGVKKQAEITRRWMS